MVFIFKLLIDSSKKTPKEGELPTLNLPEKSCRQTEVNKNSRSTLAIQKREESEALRSAKSVDTPTLPTYQSFSEFARRISTLSLQSSWNIITTENTVTMTYKESEFILPKFEIFVDHLLKYFIRIYGWMLNEDHNLYTLHKHSFEHVTFSCLIGELESFVLCSGIELPAGDTGLFVQKHIVPRKFVIGNHVPGEKRFDQKEYFRSVNCALLINSGSSCSCCTKETFKVNAEKSRKEARFSQPAKLNAPIKSTSSERLKLTIQNQR